MRESSDRLIETIAQLIHPLGYGVVHLEVQAQRQRILRLFIEKLDSDTPVGIEDCVRVSKALDEPLDQTQAIDQIFGGESYELEVSSPGLDRPLRTEQDYRKFAGQRVRIHVFRPLAPEETGNAVYTAKNPRQKNFLGALKGMEQGAVKLALEPGDTEISIPVPLISKANLEPEIESKLN